VSKNITCLLIDDDSDDYEIFCIALGQVAPSVVCVYAEDGICALQKLNTDHSFHPHLIFIDINMPRMNGIQCLSEIKKIERLQNVPVYMYSTSANRSIAEKCRQLGAADYMVKSASIGEIEATLARILSQMQ
jgi:CheY-like chemotaxis protein